MKLIFILFALVGACWSCDDNQFECVLTGACIPRSNVCDGYADCYGATDEVNCPSTTTTRCPGFECNDGSCLPASYKCDGDLDCSEGEDELDCPTTTRRPTTPCSGFVCNDGDCIPQDWVCDGWDDCWDGEDEFNCPCDGFVCDNGKCVNENYVCDGDNDCGDYSDESEEACSCDPDEIRCPSETEVPGACIPPEFVCDEDGIWDCPDGSDEANCTRSVNAHRPLEGHYRPETVKATKLRRLKKQQAKQESKAAHKVKCQSHKEKENK